MGCSQQTIVSPVSSSCRHSNSKYCPFKRQQGKNGWAVPQPVGLSLPLIGLITTLAHPCSTHDLHRLGGERVGTLCDACAKG